MVDLPVADPGVPDTRSATRLLLWVARHQVPTLVAAVSFGIVWMVALALVPFVMGRAIQEGFVVGDTDALMRWALVLGGLWVVQAFAGVMRHRNAVVNWLTASFRLAQVVAHHAARTGPALRREHSTGEVVATISNDAMRAGGAYDIAGRLGGAIVAYVVVAVLLLRTSVLLGLVVLLGVPLLVLTLSTVIRPLQERQRLQREEVGKLTALGADTAAGLRVLRGIGGEPAFYSRYFAQSQRVRESGVAVATPQSMLDAAQVLLPGIFVVIVTWLGARLVLTGDMDAGDLVAFYGYAAFLVIPLRTAAESVDKITRSYVGARRMLGVLDVEREVRDAGTRPLPGAGVTLVDTASEVRIEPGQVTALVSRHPDETAAIAARLGRLADAGGVELGGVPLAEAPLSEVRARIVVSEQEPILFSGELRTELDPWSSHTDAEIEAALEAANARDVLDALPDGLDTLIDERGRQFSGGQRQRLVLARALVSDPGILVLVEPTSAVDAHTEARIGHSLRALRAGKTTVVTTASPLLLDRCDCVVLVVAGTAVARGTHRELLRASADYRDIVTRGEAD